LDPVVDLFFELDFVDEAVDLHGAEEVADAFVDAAGEDLLRRAKGPRWRGSRHSTGYRPSLQLILRATTIFGANSEQ